jgi:hypothetical protein
MATAEIFFPGRQAEVNRSDRQQQLFIDGATLIGQPFVGSGQIIVQQSIKCSGPRLTDSILFESRSQLRSLIKR